MSLPTGGSISLTDLKNEYSNLASQLADGLSIVYDEPKTIASGFGSSMDTGEFSLVSGSPFIKITEPNEGTASFFKWENEMWIWEQTVTNQEDDFISFQFGHEVSLHESVVAAISTKENKIFIERDFEPDVFQKSLPDTGGTSFYGISTAIHGEWAVVGASKDSTLPGGEESGAVYVYRVDSGTDQYSLFQKLKGSNISKGDSFGYAVEIWENRIIVGAYSNDTEVVDSGVVYIFKYNSNAGEWEEEFVINNPFPNDSEVDFFGWSVGIWENRAVVGSYKNENPDDGTTSGTVYVYQYDEDIESWELMDTEREINGVPVLKANEGQNDDFFGASVDIWGDRIVVGAYTEDSDENGYGAVYIYQWNGTQWVLEIELKNPIPHPRDFYGWSVAIWENRVAVGGGHLNDKFSIDNGVVFVYEFNGFNWVLMESKNCVGNINYLSAENGQPDDFFGAAVDIWGDKIVIGTYLNFLADSLNDNTIVNIFFYDGDNWVERPELPDPKLNEDNKSMFGHAVAVWEDRISVGAYRNNEVDFEAGANYIYITRKELDLRPSTVQMFRKEADEWKWKRTFYNPLPESNPELILSVGSEFGDSTFIHENRMIIGSNMAPEYGVKNPNVGYIYEYNETTEEWENMPSEFETGGFFYVTRDKCEEIGYYRQEVAIYGDWAITSRYSNEQIGDGLVEIFQWDGNLWKRFQTLTGPVEVFGFGKRIDFQGDYIAVASDNEVFMFRFDNIEWVSMTTPFQFDNGMYALRSSFVESLDIWDKYVIVGRFTEGQDLDAIIYEYKDLIWQEESSVVPIAANTPEEYGKKQLQLKEITQEGIQFGKEVSIHSKKVVITAPLYDFIVDVEDVFPDVGALLTFETFSENLTYNNLQSYLANGEVVPKGEQGILGDIPDVNRLSIGEFFQGDDEELKRRVQRSLRNTFIPEPE